MKQDYPSAVSVLLFAAAINKTTKHNKIILYRDGITTIGKFVNGFHEAWAYLPKAPESLKERKRIKSEQELNK